MSIGHEEIAPGALPGRTLSLLGELAVDGVLVGTPKSSPARIIAYVVLCGPSARQRLAQCLWPEAVPERALGSLRTGLWRLQRSYPGLLVANGNTVALGPRLRVDIHDLAKAGHVLARDTEPDPGCIELLGGHAAYANLLMDAELLHGWTEEWVVAERERIRQLRLHVLEALSVRLCRHGMFGIALQAALAAHNSDPLRESAHRAVIEVHLAEGNQAEARRQYQHCLKTLRHELGVPPSRATMELGRRLEAGRRPLTRPPAA